MMSRRVSSEDAHSAQSEVDREQGRVGAMHRIAAVRIVAVLLLGMLMGAFPAAASDTECDGFLPDFLCDNEREARPAGHINPMSMPFLFEDPYIATDINLVGIYHNYPSDSLMDGGEAGVVALQARLAITDRLAFIATKDGYMINRPDNGALNNREGFMDITVGFKYAVIDDREAGLIVTPSLRYEIPLGNDQVFQGFGDGVLIPAFTMGYGPENIHLIAGVGMQIAMDDDANSTSFFYNLHLDQAFEVDFISGADFIVPFIELNGTSYVASGDGSNKIVLGGTAALPRKVPLKAVQNLLHQGNPPNTITNPTADLRGEGIDVANLGSSGMSGETIITMAWGVRVPFRNGFSTGVSYERVLSQRQDLFEQRWTWMVDYTF